MRQVSTPKINRWRKCCFSPLLYSRRYTTARMFNRVNGLRRNTAHYDCLALNNLPPSRSAPLPSAGEGFEPTRRIKREGPPFTANQLQVRGIFRGLHRGRSPLAERSERLRVVHAHLARSAYYLSDKNPLWHHCSATCRVTLMRFRLHQLCASNQDYEAAVNLVAGKREPAAIQSTRRCLAQRCRKSYFAVQKFIVLENNSPKIATLLPLQIIERSLARVYCNGGSDSDGRDASTIGINT